MKKKRFLGLILATVCSLGAFSGCASLNEIAPKAYGEWDGNYIYRGNVRSKTTGEDDEYLVESVAWEGVEYAVKDTLDSMYLEDVAYLCLSVGADENAETELKEFNCLVEYDFHAQTSRVVYYGVQSLSPEKILTVHEDYIVLQREGWRQTPYYFKIDLDGNLLEDYEIAYSDCTFLGVHKEYIIKSYNKELFYCTWQDGTLKKMLSLSGMHLNEITMQGNGFLIRTESDTKNGDVYPQGLYYYDLEKGTTATLLNIKDEKTCSVEDGYFVVGEEYLYTYYVKDQLYHDIFEKIGNILSPTWLEFHERNAIRCTLYKIDYDLGRAEEVYRFADEYEEKDFYKFSVKENGEIDFYADWVETGGSCQGNGGVESQTYTLNLNEKTLKKKKKESESVATDETPQGVACGKYIYYTSAQNYGGFMSSMHAYFIWRYDTETKESVCMQFFAEQWHMEQEPAEGEEPIIFRYSQKMWIDYDGFTYKPENFVVKAY